MFLKQQKKIFPEYSMNRNNETSNIEMEKIIQTDRKSSSPKILNKEKEKEKFLNYVL